MIETNDVKDRIRQMLKSGESAKNILITIGGKLVIQDIYNMKCDMRKAGEIAPSGLQKKPSPKNGTKKKGDEFDAALMEEIERLRAENSKFAALSVLYDKSNTGFAVHLDKKIKMNEEKLNLLEEFQKN